MVLVSSMRQVAIKSIVGPLLAGALVFAVTPDAFAGSLDCAQVIAHVDRVNGRRGGKIANARMLGARLGIEPAWIARCAAVYGRRVEGGAVSEGQQEELDKRLESGEIEQIAPEEIGEDGRLLSQPSRRAQRRRGRPGTGRDFERDLNESNPVR